MKVRFWTILVVCALIPSAVAAQSATARLKAMGYQLPPLKTTPGAAGATKVGNIVFTSMFLPYDQNGRLIKKGPIKDSSQLLDGQNAAKQAALATIAAAASEVGKISNLKRAVRVEGKVLCGDKINPEKVLKGALQVYNRVFSGGGKSTLSAVCVDNLPKNASVAISAVFEAKP